MNQELFRQYCRQPGTRINRVMTAIERSGDEDDKAIAARTKVPLDYVRVCRKALRGELSEGSKEWEARPEAAKAMIIILRLAGKKPAQISRQMGIPRSTVKSIIKRMMEKGAEE